MEKDIRFRLLDEGKWVCGWGGSVGDELQRASGLCFEFNSTHPSDVSGRERLFRSLVAEAGDGFTVHSPFRCDLGWNIRIGRNFTGNFGLCILDEAPVRIGDNVFIGPNCTIATITHALLAEQRNRGIMAARPVEIGDNVWLAAGVTVLPGARIGEGAVIGAGSVVSGTIPPRVLAAGIPCRVIRDITDADRVEEATLPPEM